MSTAPSRKRKVLLICLGAIVATALLYVLSIGPAIFLNKRGMIEVETLEMVYGPLNFVLMFVPGGPQLVDRYIQLWV